MSNLDIITISDSISPGNMPYNEFVLYRYHHAKQYDQQMIVFFQDQIDTKVDYPEDLPIFRCGTDLKKIRRVVSEIVEDCKKREKPIVFHIHEAKSVLLFHAATRAKYRKQTVYTLHSTFSNYPLRNKLLAVLASIASRKVVCVSQTSYAHYPSLLKRIFGNKVICIQNGVDCARVNHILDSHPLPPGPLKREKLRLIYVARLIPLKQHDILLHALKKLPECEISFIGQGEKRDSLQALAEEYGISGSVHFLGFIPRDEVYLQIQAHDVYVSSSSYEGLPISVLEAMSCGVVCAVSDIAQHREIQEKCPSLMTVKNTADGWVSAIQGICALSAEERTKIGNQNKKDADQFFSLARMHAQYDLVYDEVAKGIDK